MGGRASPAQFRSSALCDLQRRRIRAGHLQGPHPDGRRSVRRFGRHDDSAFAAGANKGYIYIRGEYPLATERLGHAIRTARVQNLLGESILGSGFSLEVEIRRGAGAYICGEETALFNSIEGYRGEPRNKPPFPTQSGLFHQPTAVNK